MKSSLRNMVLSLGCVSIVVAGLLAAVNSLTADRIALNASMAETEAVATVMPRFANNPMADTLTVDGCRIYPGRVDGRLTGAAVLVTTNEGFSGPLTIMVGFDAEGGLTDYSILESTETPGLGDKAAEWFRDPEGRHSVIGSRDELTVAKDGGNIDGITAATITSRAFLGAVNRARAAFLKFSNQDNTAS